MGGYIVNRQFRFLGRTLTLRVLDERERGKRQLFNARWWVSYFGKGTDPDHYNAASRFQGEVVIPSSTCGLTLRVSPSGDDRGDFAWNVCLPPISTYWGVHWKPLEKLGRRLLALGMSTVERNHYNARDVGVRVFDDAIWWDCWQTVHEWRSGTPRWQSGCWHPMDTFFGKSVYADEVVETTDVEVPMPEGVYMGICKLSISTWTRPGLWFWPRMMRSATIDMAKGQAVPFPGKGENSWDCGEDAIYSKGCNASTAEEAVGSLVASALRSRGRHGGRRWRPEKGPYGKHNLPPGATVVCFDDEIEQQGNITTLDDIINHC